HWGSYLWTKDRVAALWDSSRAIPWLDAGLRQLPVEENILFLADHGARHGWCCLKWLSDIAMLAESLSEDTWLSLYKKAGFFDLQRVICQTAVLLEWFYGVVPPQSFKAIYLPDARVQKLSVHAASYLLASGDVQGKRFAGVRQALRIKQLKPSTPLALLARSVLITHTDFVKLPLPDALFWLYIPLRPLLWFQRHYSKSRSNTS
ncbi:MAG TPA: nucleotidyltransferase family protein, partial [Geobacteraceae bacterium]|nr:nucleotidyltransferase family protein [Geobacteraceae bacterium]